MSPRPEAIRKSLGVWVGLAAKAISAAAVLAVAADFCPAWAQGTLVISPTRVVLEGRTRSVEVTLINTGTVTTSYRIRFKNMRMREDGALEEIEEPGPGDLFADHMMRYAPRQVVLEPGVAQTVRILLRKPKDLPPGEYRSHLEFVTVPDETAGTDVEALDLGEGEIRVSIRMLFGVSIAVIVRHGELSATVAVSDLVLEAGDDPDAPLALSLRLDRSGDRSVYGDMTVTFKPDGGGGEIEVGLIRGIAVYTPNESRAVQIRLRPPEGVALEGGRLHVAYRERPDEGGAVLAEAELAVP